MKYLKIKEVQQQYLSGKLCARWWYSMVKKIPHTKAGGKLLFTADDVEAFCNSLLVEPEKVKQEVNYKHFPI
jgi:hypothetical protein